MNLAKKDDSETLLSNALAGFDALIAQCEQDREKHALLVRELDDRIDTYKRLRGELIKSSANPAGPDAAKLASATPTEIDFFANRDRERTNSTAWKVRKMAYLALKSVGRPLTRAELLRELTAMDMQFNSKNPARAIGKILWEADEFEHTKLGYWIKGEPVRTAADSGKRFRSKAAAAK